MSLVRYAKLVVCHQLNVNANDHKAIPLFPFGFMEALDSPEAF